MKAIAAFAIAVAIGVPIPVIADAPPAPAKVAEAKQLYEEGSDAFSHGDYSTAVTKLGRSFDLVPSPNAELVLARALRETGKLAESAKHFKACEGAAHERVAKGDERFRDTEKDASTEGAAVRQRVATLEVSAPNAKPGATVEVDGTSMPISNGHTEAAFHDPGDVAVTLKTPEGAPVTKTVHLEAGKTGTATFESAPSDTVSGGRRKWAVPGAIASGGVAAIGFGLFIGFGVHSESIYSDLSGCRPRCPAAQYAAKAQSGANAQNAANAFVTVASLATVACGAFVVLTLTDHPSDDASTSTSLGISPLGISLSKDF